MRIVFRNFTRVLSIGAFNSNLPVEPMSDYKWYQLLNLAYTKNVSDIITKGILNILNTNKNLIPASIAESINADQDAHYGQLKKTARNTEKKFQCSILNRKYNKLIFNERHSIDTSIECIELIDLLIASSQSILHSDLNIREIVRLGLFLREEGDKTDFIKVEKWISSLNMRKITNIIGSYLIILCGFEKDEIPFLKRYDVKLYGKTCKSLCKCMARERECIKTEDDGNGEQNYKVETGALKYLTTIPAEAISIFTVSILKSLSNIEE